MDEYDQEEGSEFDANELLDLTDYKQKRGIPSVEDIANIRPNPKNAAKPKEETKPSVFPPPATKAAAATAPAKSSAKPAGADEAWDLEGSDDGWGSDNLDDLKEFDYQNTDLNKMSDFMLNRHKENMDKDFSKNVIKPGDKGYEYDKRVDFKKASGGKADWDSDGDKEEGGAEGADKGQDEYYDDDYFDDDFA